ncbi:MAG: metallophosphoesterase [Bacteroidia bacterium]
MKKIGIISDTHGLLRPQATEALQGVDHILHAGDVGTSAVLEALQKIAPVTVVRGNVDKGDFGKSLPMTEAIELGGVWFYMIHILQDLDIDPTAAGMDVVVFGHSHKPADYVQDGSRFINPGSAGARRFSLPVSLILAEVADGKASFELIELV